MNVNTKMTIEKCFIASGVIVVIATMIMTTSVIMESVETPSADSNNTH